MLNLIPTAFAKISRWVTELPQQTWGGSSSTGDGEVGVASSFLESASTFIEWTIIVLLILFLAYLLLRFMRFFYELFTYKDIVRIRIMLPRADSKLDKEQETKKDFKEKIGVMSGVYKSLHAVQKTTLWDTIKDKIFNHIKLSYEMVYDGGKLYFYICTYKQFYGTVASQVTSYYTNAEVEIIDEKDYIDLNMKGYHLETASLYKEEDDVFPIKTYKYFEDDPLNTFTNVFGTLGMQDKAVYQIISKPLSDSWNDKAKSAARLFAKGEYRPSSKKRGLTGILMKLLSPFSWFFQRFIRNESTGGSTDGSTHPGASSGDTYKIFSQAETEAQKMVGEVAGQPAYECSIRVLVSSQDKHKAFETMKQLIASSNVYTDEYTNQLDNPQFWEDAFRKLFNKIRHFAFKYKLIGLFQEKNVYAIDELLSLYHFPDVAYNQSPILAWSEYRKLPVPTNIKHPKDPLIMEEYVKNTDGAILAKDGTPLKTSKNGVLVRGEKNELLTVDDAPIEMNKEKPALPADPKKLPQTQKKQKTLGGFPLYKDMILLGWNEYRNKKTPVYFAKKDRSRHHYIIGKSGSGKSAFMNYMARQDLWNGDGLSVIDPHGDLIEDIISYTPKERAKDMVIFDPADYGRPMGINMLEVISSDPDQRAIEKDRAALDATSIFIKIFNEEIFGPRIQHYFRNGALTLMDDEEDGGTLIDVPRLFVDEAFRKYKTSKVQNSVVKSFWDHEYANTGDREKQEMIPYFSAKFGPFITNTTIRNIIGQPKSAFNIREIMDTQKALMVNLSKGKIGDLNAQLLGLIMVSKINMAAMSRADMPEDDRKDFFLYVDEFQNFATDTFGEILSEARKYKLALIMAHQFIAQIDNKDAGSNKPSIKEAVFGNVGTMMSFKIGADDAEYFEREYAPVLSQQDIIGVANYTLYGKLNINNASTRPFDMKTIWDPTGSSSDTARLVKEYSRKKYGRKKKYVDMEIESRLGLGKTASPNPESSIPEESNNTPDNPNTK